MLIVIIDKYQLPHSLSLIWFILITLSDSEGMDTHILTRISKQYVRHTVTYNYEHSKRKGTIASTLLLILLQYTKRTKKEEPILCQRKNRSRWDSNPQPLDPKSNALSIAPHDRSRQTHHSGSFNMLLSTNSPRTYYIAAYQFCK